MQSFKYDLPAIAAAPSLRSRRRPRSRWLAVLALGAVGAVAWASTPWSLAAALLGLSPADATALHLDATAAKRALAEGEDSLRAGAAVEAVRTFDHALQLDPTLLVAYQRGLDARALAGQPAPGLAQVLPQPAARLPFLLARADEEATRRPAAALDDLDQALVLSPTDAHALRARAALAAKGPDQAAAITTYEQALRVLPDDLPLAAALVRLRYQAGSVDHPTQLLYAKLATHAADAHDESVPVALIGATLGQGQSPEALRAQIQTDFAGFTEAERRLYTARAYVQHFHENPNWHREDFALALQAAHDVLAAGNAATAEEAFGAREVILEALSTRAARQADHNDMAGARNTLDQAIAERGELLGRDKRLAHRFADLYAQRARLGPEGDVATRAMEAALALDPSHAIARELAHVDANGGVSLLGAKKTAQALPLLARAVALAPDDASVLARYHQALTVAGIKSPLAACAKASGIPTHGELIAAVLEGYARNGQAGTASTLYNTIAGSLEAGEKAAGRAELRVAQGQLVSARALYNNAAESAPSAFRFRRLANIDRALAGKLKGQDQLDVLERARHEALLALSQSGAVQDRSRALALAHQEVTAANAMHDLNTVKRVAAEGLGLDPRNPSLGLALAEALAHSGELDAAINACRAGLTGLNGGADAAHAPLRERLGSLYRSQKRYAEAIAEYKAGLDVHPPTPLASDLTYGLALAHAGNGDRQEAINAIRQYVAGSQHDTHQDARVAKMQALELELRAKHGT